jgi:hypothetical protein
MLDELQLTYTSYNGQNLNSPAVSVIRGATVLHTCVCVCVRARVCACVPGRIGMRVRAYSLAYPACNACAPYCDVICGPSVSTTFFDIIS